MRTPELPEPPPPLSQGFRLESGEIYLSPTQRGPSSHLRAPEPRNASSAPSQLRDLTSLALSVPVCKMELTVGLSRGFLRNRYVNRKVGIAGPGTEDHIRFCCCCYSLKNVCVWFGRVASCASLLGA